MSPLKKYIIQRERERQRQTDRQLISAQLCLFIIGLNVFFFKVFDGILQSVGESRREWTIIGCDALPYTIGHRVLENVHSCPQCHCEFLSEEELVEHSKKTSMKVIRNSVGNTRTSCLFRVFIFLLLVQYSLLEYKFYYLIKTQFLNFHFTVLSHYEINMVKALFKLLWDVGLCV